MKSVNENVLPEQFAQRLAELAAEVDELSRRLRLVEEHSDLGSPAQQTNLTIHSYDDDDNSIHYLTENGFVIVRPWETNEASAPAEGTFSFRVQDPEGIEREIRVAISNRLLLDIAQRTRGRIETSSQFWICCAEHRLANYLMERDQFPPENEIIMETLDREEVLLSLRWGKTT